MNKKCPHCNLLKTNDDFPINHSKVDGLGSHCKECKKIYQSNWYQNNKSSHIKQVHIRREEVQKIKRIFILEYLQLHHCIDCGENDPIVLEFDHIKGNKYAAISTIVSGNSSLGQLTTELQKCVVRCANCHRRRLLMKEAIIGSKALVVMQKALNLQNSVRL